MKPLPRAAAMAVFWIVAGMSTVSPAASDLPAVTGRVASGTRLVEVSREGGETARGTGFFVGPDGFFVTTSHLLKGGDRIMVKKSAEDTGFGAKLLVEMEGWDLAVLDVDARERPSRDECLRLADLPVHPSGTDVAYSGYAFGTDLNFMAVYSTYRGVISSVMNQENDGVRGHLYNLGSLVISGLSGGPLFLPDSGMVIGVVARHYGPRGTGVGFGGAVAADVLSSLMDKARAAGSSIPSPREP